MEEVVLTEIQSKGTYIEKLKRKGSKGTSKDA